MCSCFFNSCKMAAMEPVDKEWVGVMEVEPVNEEELELRYISLLRNVR